MSTDVDYFTFIEFTVRYFHLFKPFVQRMETHTRTQKTTLHNYHRKVIEPKWHNSRRLGQVL